ncbi:MAG: cation diffusion facilitator family transporter [Bacteroidetes bacterium]|nr:cation diffusion facilitator family transporter [Bacteroidota bacterium]
MPSKRSIYSALAADLLIAITKFIAGSISHSAAMIAEGVHSIVDSSNGLLLLFGLYKSKQKPDKEHPFGYGKELYFWSFIVSILFFGLGGGISIYQGIQHILKPVPPDSPVMNYIVLAISFIFEAVSMIIPTRQFYREKGDLSWWTGLIRSKDPTIFTVLLENFAAIIGVLIVAISVFLNQQFHLPYIDGLASLLVGLLLVGVSLIIARESRSLLMGEGIADENRKRIIALVEKDDDIDRVINIHSIYQSPDEIILMLIVAFKDGLETENINKAIDRLSKKIKKDFPRVRYIMIEPHGLAQRASV